MIAMETESKIVQMYVHLKREMFKIRDVLFLNHFVLDQIVLVLSGTHVKERIRKLAGTTYVNLFLSQNLAFLILE